MLDRKYFNTILKILNHIDTGVHIIDENGMVVYYNDAARDVDEIEIKKAVGRHVLDVYPSLNFESSTLLKAIRTCKPIMNVEQNFLNYKGDKISTINSSFPIVYNNKVIGAVEISKNITQVKELNETILNLKSKLLESDFDIPSSKILNKKKKKGAFAKYTFLDIIGQNKEIMNLKTKSIRAAQSNSPVLVSGDTGTGKELFVQAIHNASDRANKPFIAQNCAALPATLLESILFGSEKGSFTGAENKAGLFELANGGTLFLDEVNSMPIELQGKLLRVLQDGRIRRVGAGSTVDVDVRIISAMNIDPVQAITDKQLRTDLYYRLNVININIPKLVDRKDDIPIFVDYFINKYNNKLGKHFRGISEPVRILFDNYAWLGNVRELEHCIESIISLYDGDIITIDQLPYLIKNSEQLNRKNKLKPCEEIDDSLSLNESIQKFESTLIKNALMECDNNISRAAEMLQIPRQTLQYKIKKMK